MEELPVVMPPRMQPGEHFAGKYVVEGVLGTGGMSVVLAALHEGLGQKVAIKLLLTRHDLPPDGVKRFQREARAAASLRSEHSARVIDVDVDPEGRHFIVMEHLEGLDLGQVLRKGAPLAVETAVGYVLHACEAMAEAHALGIIHRDLKPQNLFLTQGVDGSPLVKVLDFGISKVLAPQPASGSSSSLSNPHTLIGTPSYMSPEQIRTPAELDGRSDVWALGVILFELLTNEEPHGGETIPDIIAAVLCSTPPSPTALRAEIPEALGNIVLACLEKDVSRRVANVGLLAQALRPWAPAWARDAATRASRICAMASGTSEIERDAEPGPWAVSRPLAVVRSITPGPVTQRRARRPAAASSSRRTAAIVGACLLGGALALRWLPSAVDVSGSPISSGERPGTSLAAAQPAPAPAPITVTSTGAAPLGNAAQRPPAGPGAALGTQAETAPSSGPSEPSVVAVALEDVRPIAAIDPPPAARRPAAAQQRQPQPLRAPRRERPVPVDPLASRR